MLQSIDGLRVQIYKENASYFRFNQFFFRLGIDTGDEVILVDTGLPAGFPDGAPEETAPIYIGKSICDYMDALAALGYKPEQVTKILLTHKHADHSGELRSFPNAKI